MRDRTTRGHKWFDAMSVIARKKLNAPPQWEWHSARVIKGTDDSLIVGGVPNLRNDGTARQGRMKWVGVVDQECIVTRPEIAAAQMEYEATTGLCVNCMGSGEEVAGCGGGVTRYRPCKRCNALGCAPLVQGDDQ